MKRIKTWDELEAEGFVRFKIVADEFFEYDDLAGDCFSPTVNSDIPSEKLASEEASFKERIERDGVWGIVTEFFDGSKWVRGDSVWGFVGDDWKGSGYDTDIKECTRQTFLELKKCPKCKRPLGVDHV